MFELNHVCSEHTPKNGGKLPALPVGDYTAIITEATQEPTKAGTGAYLNLKIQIVDGEAKNRVVWDILNLWNPNSQAVEIAQGTLTAIGDAIGLDTITAPTQICNKTLTVSLKQVMYNGDMKNKVKGYKKYDKFAQSTPMSQQSTAATNVIAPQADMEEAPF